MNLQPTNSDYIFFGTDDFAVMVLEELKLHSLSPKLIVTTPDTNQGRKLLLTPPPVKIWAEKNAIPIIQPSTLTPPPPEIQNNNYLFFLVASYGKIIPQPILDLAPMGILNIHPSLLPKYRGATPLETAILNGDRETGVTIMKIDNQMDHGDILAQATLDTKDKDYLDLEAETASLGVQTLIAILPDYLAGTLTLEKQDHSQATFTKKLTKADGLIKLTDDPTTNYRKFLAYRKWPGIYFFITKDGKQNRIKITNAHLEDNQFIIDTVIPEGKKETTWDLFNKTNEV